MVLGVSVQNMSFQGIKSVATVIFHSMTRKKLRGSSMSFYRGMHGYLSFLDSVSCSVRLVGCGQIAKWKEYQSSTKLL